MSYTLYILRDKNNKLYIGQTNNIQRRENEQTRTSSKAAKYVKEGIEFKIVYTEIYKTRLDVMRREKQLKAWTRAKKEALIAGNLLLLKVL